jgi:hypothetical protein
VLKEDPGNREERDEESGVDGESGASASLLSYTNRLDKGVKLLCHLCFAL